MILELYHSLRSSAPRYAREMGYVRESTAIRARYKRCFSAWQSHIDASRNICLDAVQSCTAFEHCVVIGAGLLFDVPLADLSARFQRVTLIDIVFSEETRAIADSFGNVICSEWDITGCVHTFYDVIQVAMRSSKEMQLPPPANALYEILQGQKCDCIISASILSQLAVLPKIYAEKQRVFDRCTPEQWRTWETLLMRTHIETLCAMSDCVCIMYDVERTILKQERKAGAMYERMVDRESAMGYFSTNHITEMITVSHSVCACKEWMWDIAPLGEEHKHFAVRHKVCGITAVRQST